MTQRDAEPCNLSVQAPQHSPGQGCRDFCFAEKQLTLTLWHFDLPCACVQAYARLAREHHPDLNGGSAPANRIWEGVALVERFEAGEPGARLSEEDMRSFGRSGDRAKLGF